MSTDEQPPWTDDLADATGADVREDGSLFELLHRLIAPGPDAPFGELGLEGFVREFWIGFAGQGDQADRSGDWARLRALNERLMNTAALGALISRARVHAERAIERVIAEAQAEDTEADTRPAPSDTRPARRRPVMVDAAFLRDHGWTLVAALAGAVAQAIAADGKEPTGADRPKRRLPRLRRPWRFDVLSIAEAAVGGLVATGRTVGARLGALTGLPGLPQVDVPHLMALAATMLPLVLGQPETAAMVAPMDDSPDDAPPCPPNPTPEDTP